MKSTLLPWLAITMVCWLNAYSAVGAEYYITPNGSNTNDGSVGGPWGTFDFAFNQLMAGDTLFVGGGSYDINSRLRIQNGGTQAAPINIWAVPGDPPILDFDSMTTSWGSSSGRGIQIDEGANWLHIKGLTIQNARDNGIWSGANHGTFEQTVTRWNGDSGLQLSGAASNNLILNADSYENYDPSNNGENADGFAIKFENLGPGNIVRGACAWGNSDDGWDMWESTTGGVLVEDSWAFDNGKIIQQFYDKELLENSNLTPSNFNGDGNGFKLGQTGGPHVLNRVLVWENEVRGIDVNGNGFGVEVNNSTVYSSGRNWQFDETSSETSNQHVLTNNISLAGSSSDIFQSGVDSSFNTWNGIAVSTNDFLSLDDAIARGPRQADGSLPVSDFLRLASDSNLIDAGVDVGLPFDGSAPDLGAYEIESAVLLGDFNNDGTVNVADFTLWRDNLEASDESPINDAGDGLNGVDQSDYDVWRAQFGQTMAALTGRAEAMQAVPEPSSLVLLTVLGLACVVRMWPLTIARRCLPVLVTVATGALAQRPTLKCQFSRRTGLRRRLLGSGSVRGLVLERYCVPRDKSQ